MNNLIPVDLDATFFLPKEESKSDQHIIELPLGEIDPRVKLISHSSRSNLHKCPKKYQLYRLQSKDSGEEDKNTEITFSYGSTVGIGIQGIIEGKSESDYYIDMLKEWEVDLLEENPKQKKSFWEAIFAVQQFESMRNSGYLDDYEIVIYEGKPAVELSFIINLPDGFKYRGFIDVVLKHKTTGAILVLELKTTRAEPNASSYRNSGQAIGYSVVLDLLFPRLSSYQVLYLVYGTTSRRYEEFFFSKSLLQRALWLQHLLIDCEVIQLYEKHEAYPTHGENCYDFFRECEYLGLCNLNIKSLTKPLTQTILDKIEADNNLYQFSVDFQDLIQSQLNRDM